MLSVVDVPSRLLQLPSPAKGRRYGWQGSRTAHHLFRPSVSDLDSRKGLQHRRIDTGGNQRQTPTSCFPHTTSYKPQAASSTSSMNPTN